MNNPSYLHILDYIKNFKWKLIAFPHLKKVMNLKFVNLLINGWAWDKASISCFYSLGIWEIFQVSFNCKKIHRLHNSGCRV
jgi:hypothetical protein